MNIEQYNSFCEKHPIAAKMVNMVIVPIAGIIAAFGIIVACFIGSQMFDDKHTYDSGNTVVDFIHWFSGVGFSDATTNSSGSN